MGCSPSKSPTTILVASRPSSDRSLSPGESDETVLILPTGASASDALQEEIIPPDIKVDGNFEHEDKLEASILSRISGMSTSSGQSTQSWDSGVYELDEDYAHVITEQSDPVIVKLVENQFQPHANLELVLEGKACPRKLSPKDKERLEQHVILEMLREEGLIVRPESRAVGGVRFELVAAKNLNPYNPSSPMLHRLPPLRLREKHKKKKKKELTYEQIEQKLMKAEERRKKQEEEKLSKLASKERLVTTSTVEENRQKIEEKMEAITRSREQHLRDVQEKLKAKEKHANRVRMRKQMLAEGFNSTLLHRKQ